MRALDRKLFRDVLRMRGQLFTIALVVACGATSFVTMRCARRALETSRDVFYARQRFGDAFARVKRAPDALIDELAQLPGIAVTETRIVEEGVIDLPAEPDRVVARLMSLPEHGAPLLNVPHRRSGRGIERPDEALLLESFAVARGIALGDELHVIIQEHELVLRVVGTVLSPELVFPVIGGDPFSDERRSAALWVSRGTLARALAMEGSFSEVSFMRERGAPSAPVLREIDRILAPYGGTGAIPRARQPSNRFVEGELQQLEIQANTIPVIFLLVAGLLLSVVLSRIVRTERTQIASLRALGYSGGALGRHYAEIASIVVLVGTALGAVAGARLGGALVHVYAQYFRFPLLEPRLDAIDVVMALGVCAIAGLAGTLAVVVRVIRLPPAEGMRPEVPPTYHHMGCSRARRFRHVSGALRMILREIERRPLRASSTIMGIALAEVVLVLGLLSHDSVHAFVELEFRRGDRSDMTVQLVNAVPRSALRSFASLPGVLSTEPMHAVPVRLRTGVRSKETELVGLSPNAELRRIVNPRGDIERVPCAGLAVTPPLIESLALAVGDEVTVEVLEGDRPVRTVRVTALVEEMLGSPAYMRLDELDRLLRAEPSMNAVLLRVEHARVEDVLWRLKVMPLVGGVGRREVTIADFDRRGGGVIVVLAMILTAFASAIALGVVYNAARVSLAERSRDFATLRVLGFTTKEISTLLFGELALLMVVAVPLGLFLGARLGRALMEAMIDPELFRIPIVIEPKTYAFAAAVVSVVGVASALGVRRRLSRLELVSVLKAAD